MNTRLLLTTFLVMLAFAGNSVLCRLALTDKENSPISFTIIRLSTAAVGLYLFMWLKNKKILTITKNSFFPSLLLTGYAVFFSLAYTQIQAGAGALILFATVQFVMIAVACIQGERPCNREILGMAISFTGFIYLFLPNLEAPPIFPALLMMVSGLCWGFYSLRGKKEKNAELATAKNFTITLPLMLVLYLALPFKLNQEGLIWACLSGAVTSALGYIVWYKIIKELNTTTASISQLTVPLLAAVIGGVFLNEKITLHFLISSAFVLTGIFVKIIYKKKI